MNGFLGTYSVSLDDKGRLNVPAKFKALLEQDSPQLVTCVMDGFLIVFPQREWAANEEKLSHLNAFDKNDRNRLREFYARATECEIKSGKVLISAVQREAAGLKKEVTIVGMSKTFELWAPDRLKKTSN
jgi:MraZ protein|tara:strand:+ start:101 stop:487 length:387 start_codon:yes stop_codon:yes gene_type:complete